jgi:putative ABC transport system permease protein
MAAVLRQFRRAPGRIIASIVALALAVGAVGVLAIPTISTGSLHHAVERDGLADIIVPTTPIDPAVLDELATVDGVARIEGEASHAVVLDDGALTRLIGLDLPTHTMDRLQLTAGRLPGSADEVVTSPTVGPIGSRVAANGDEYRIVGHGSTLWWAADDVLYAPLDTVTALTGGANRLVITAVDDGEDELRAISDEIRRVLRSHDGTYTDFPVFLPDGTTPIDADIEQVSSLIGLLGVFAGLVALVLLAGTTNTLITERTREVAVMRALGGRSRPLRRRLRRIALGITTVALVIGLPLGIVISNVIARMVLEEFVGITPAVAADWRVLAGSAVGALVGARLVAARAARRVTRLPLAEALRDRDGAPFGARWAHRFVTRLPLGGLASRLAARTSLRRPARTAAVVSQIAAAVGAAFLVPSLVSSVNQYNESAMAPWSWESMAVARDPGLPIEVAAVDAGADPTAEAAVWSFGEIDDWEIEIFGIEPDSAYFDVALRDGRWVRPAGREAMVSAGFAARRSIDVGDTVDVELAGGPARYTVVGTVEDFGRAIYLDRSTVADDLGAPGMANVVWSESPSSDLGLPVAVEIETAAQVAADNNAGRDAIVMIFAAIGAIVAGVAALAVMSTMTVNLFERRHELAAMQAIGARRSRIRGLLVRELLPVGALGIAVGLGLGALGTRGIIASFEASNAVDIGVVDSLAAIPFVTVGAVLALVLLAVFVARSTERRPIALTLRGAA